MKTIKTKELFIILTISNCFFSVRHLLLVILFVGGLAFNCCSQSWLWAKNAGGSARENEEGWSVSADTSGNVFVTGSFCDTTITFGTITFTNTSVVLNAGTYDVFIAKYDPSGNLLWAKHAGGTGVDQSLSVSTDQSGNAFITGYFSSATIMFGTIALAKTNTSDIFIAKYDATGNVLWAKKAGVATNNLGKSVSTDINGNAIVTGFYTNAGVTSVFLTKYNASGNVLWTKSAGGNSQGYSVSVDVGGNIFVTGVFKNPSIIIGTITLNNTVLAGNTYDVFIAKYNTSGNVLWAKNVGGIGDDWGYSISSADAGGNMFVTGSFSSPAITFGSATLNNVDLSGTTFDVFLAKYDASGNVLWAISAGDMGDDRGYSLGADASGNVFLAGGFSSPTITFGLNILFGGDAFIVKYDANGNALCASVIGSGGDDSFGVCADRFGNAYIGSDFEGNTFVVGSDTLTQIGIESVYVAKFNCSIMLSAGTSHTDLVCNGQCVGTATVNPNGGVSPYTYSWSNGKTTPTITGLCAGNYTVIVMDAISAAITQTISITEPALLTVGITSTSLICNGNNNGTATANVSGGTSPYSYSWNNAQNSSTINNLIVGDYTITVTDNNSCTSKAATNIAQPAPLVTTTIITVNTTCGNNNGSATIIISGGTVPYTYDWSTGNTNATVSNLIAATYTVTVTDANNCIITTTINITNSNGPSVAIIVVQEVSCNGNSDGILTTTVTGGTLPYSYQWNTNAISNQILTLPIGNYTVTVTDGNGCTAKTSASITQPAVLSVTITSINVSCNGNSNGSATANVSGGTSPYTYLWSNGQNNATINNLAVGNYTVTVTDANNCSAKKSILITEPALLTVTISPTVGCGANNASASATATGGTPAYSYQWNNGTATAINNNLSTGVYTVTVTDSNNCTAQKTINVLSGTTLTATVSNDTTIVLGTSTILHASGGGTYQWSPSTGLSCADCPNPIVSPSETTKYCVTLTDGNNCKDTACVIVNVDIHCEPYIPTAFSPNLDSENETECVYGTTCMSIIFKLYNRWGEVVFETTDPQICWDGIYKDQLMQSAVFFYTFEGKNMSSKEIIFKRGTVTLIR